MADVKQRMLDICETVPEDFFDGLKPTEMVFKLMFEYIDRYGKDEFVNIIKDNKINDYKDGLLTESINYYNDKYKEKVK